MWEYHNSQLAFYQNGTYNLGLTVSDIYGCVYSVSDSISLQHELDLNGFFIPNVITPNQDYYNDELELPSSFTSCFNYTMNIYNRWGISVYTMTQDTPHFSGRTHDGTEVPDGVYYYTLEVQDYPCLETLELRDWCTGTVSIFRD